VKKLWALEVRVSILDLLSLFGSLRTRTDSKRRSATAVGERFFSATVFTYCIVNSKLW